MRTNLQLGQSINTYDLAHALLGETGKFKVRGPNEEELVVTCEAGKGITGFYWIEQTNKPFTVTKISEPAHMGEFATTPLPVRAAG